MPRAAAFVSYSRVDLAFVRRLVQDLKVAGVSVWLDTLDIRPGKEWDLAVEEALTESPRMLLVLSPTSASSHNVLDEISLARRTNKVIIPILYQDCILPLRVCRLQYIDFRTDYAGHLEELIAHLKRHETTTTIPVMRPSTAQAGGIETERMRVPLGLATVEPAPFTVPSQATEPQEAKSPANDSKMTLPRFIAAQLSKARRAIFGDHA